MVRDNTSELYKKQQSLLAELRKIVGNKRLEFSDSYIKARKGNTYPTLGIAGSEMAYYGVTRHSVMCPCRIIMGHTADNAEFGAFVRKYSLYRYFDGMVVKQIKLEDLFVKDLEQVVADIKFFLWWEAQSHFPSVEKLYKETLAYKEKYEKLVNM